MAGRWPSNVGAVRDPLRVVSIGTYDERRHPQAQVLGEGLTDIGHHTAHRVPTVVEAIGKLATHGISWTMIGDGQGRTATEEATGDADVTWHDWVAPNGDAGALPIAIERLADDRSATAALRGAAMDVAEQSFRPTAVVAGLAMTLVRAHDDRMSSGIPLGHRPPPPNAALRWHVVRRHLDKTCPTSVLELGAGQGVVTRTASSGRHLQPPSCSGPAIWWSTASFRQVRRHFLHRGPGLVGLARRPL